MRARARARRPRAPPRSRAGGGSSASASRGCPSGAGRTEAASPRPGQRLAEERDRRGDARKVVAADAHAEEHLRTVDVREAGVVGDRPAAVEQLQRRLDFAALHPCPGLRTSVREYSSSGAPVASTAVREFSSSSIASSYCWALASASARESIASTRLRSSAETPFSRKLASTPSLTASHSIVSRVGRVLPRSIWLTYSLEKRSPATSLWVRPRSDAKLPQTLAQACAGRDGGDSALGG